MQLAICCSPLQSGFVRALALRLERNLGIATLIIEDDVEPLWALWDQATGADAVLLMLDAVSAGGPPQRSDWEPLLEHAGSPPVAILRAEPCLYPRLLERRPFLAIADPLEAGRWVERWLVAMLPPHDGVRPAANQAPVPDEWWRLLVDQPGLQIVSCSETGSAQEFAARAAAQFQGVEWIGCDGRAPEAIIGHVEHVTRNAQRLLIVLAHVDQTPDLPPGPHSYLILEGQPALVPAPDLLASLVGACQASVFPARMIELMRAGRPAFESLVRLLDSGRELYRSPVRFTADEAAEERHLAALHAAFVDWRLQTSLCRELVSEVTGALRHGLAHNWPLASELCLQAALFLLSEKRNREAVYWLRTLADEASWASDESVAERARKELVWLVDDAGEARPGVVHGEQLALPF